MKCNFFPALGFFLSFWWASKPVHIDASVDNSAFFCFDPSSYTPIPDARNITDTAHVLAFCVKGRASFQLDLTAKKISSK